MEVHHHAHTARKKWSHYFWEFLMLFLAVFCGFLAEYQLEHTIEHQRAKVYAKGMVENLESDTTELKEIIVRGEYAKNYLDSFLTLITEKDFNQIPTGKLYFYGLWGGYLRGFEPNDATFQQMKNSGSIRYFKNRKLEQTIGKYDQILRSMRRLQDFDQFIQLEIRKVRAKIFDFHYNHKANRVVQQYVYRNFNQEAIDSFMLSNPPLLTQDKIIINEYAELCRSRSLRQQLNNSIEALTLAKEIIVLLKEEFHLK